MVKPKPFSEEEITNFQQLVDQVEKDMPPMLLIKPGYIEAHKNYRRFLDTIANYKKALDSAMRQVSSLNQGNIADCKRIEELEEINRVHRDLRPDETGVLHIIKLKEDGYRDAKTIADQAATIKQLEEILEEEGYRFPEKEARQAIGKEEVK